MGCGEILWGSSGPAESVLAQMLRLLSRHGAGISEGAQEHQLLSACHRQLDLNIHTKGRLMWACSAPHDAIEQAKVWKCPKKFEKKEKTNLWKQINDIFI